MQIQLRMISLSPNEPCTATISSFSSSTVGGHLDDNAKSMEECNTGMKHAKNSQSADRKQTEHIESEGPIERNES